MIPPNILINNPAVVGSSWLNNPTIPPMTRGLSVNTVGSSSPVSGPKAAVPTITDPQQLEAAYNTAKQEYDNWSKTGFDLGQGNYLRGKANLAYNVWKSGGKQEGWGDTMPWVDIIPDNSFSATTPIPNSATTPNVTPQVNIPSIFNNGPLNNYTQPFTMPNAQSTSNQSMKNLASSSMDLWDYKPPSFDGVSTTGAANWSDLLNFGG